MADAKTYLNEAEKKMTNAVEHLKDTLAHIRAGKADIRLLDGIKVESYGTLMPISNVAAVTIPDAFVPCKNSEMDKNNVKGKIRPI